MQEKPDYKKIKKHINSMKEVLNYSWSIISKEKQIHYKNELDQLEKEINILFNNES